MQSRSMVGTGRFAFAPPHGHVRPGSELLSFSATPVPPLANIAPGPTLLTQQRPTPTHTASHTSMQSSTMFDKIVPQVDKIKSQKKGGSSSIAACKPVDEGTQAQQKQALQEKEDHMNPMSQNLDKFPEQVFTPTKSAQIIGNSKAKDALAAWLKARKKLLMDAYMLMAAGKPAIAPDCTLLPEELEKRRQKTTPQAQLSSSGKKKTSAKTDSTK